MRELRKLDRPTQGKILTAIEGLETNPRPPGVEKLSGHPDFFRIRVSDHRVIYAIPRKKVVVVCGVRNRKNAYRQLNMLNSTLKSAISEIETMGQSPELQQALTLRKS